MLSDRTVCAVLFFCGYMRQVFCDRGHVFGQAMSGIGEPEESCPRLRQGGFPRAWEPAVKLPSNRLTRGKR